MSETAAEPSAESSASQGSSPGDDAIVADALTKYYGDFTAIENVSFTVPVGRVTAFLGPNGAGKSTCMRILTGYLAPSSGRATIAGYDVEDRRLEASRILGYLPENGPLYHDMTPAGFLRYIGQVRGMGAGDLKRALERVVDRCHLAEVWHKPIRKLSKGFRQRVGLAQAILHDPKVLIMDEPTSGLDPRQVVLVRQLVRELAETKTLLLSTHILQEVEAMADRMVVINEGRKVYDGTPREFVGDGKLEQRFLELVKGGAET